MVIRAYEEADRAAVDALAPRLLIGTADWLDSEQVLAAVRGWIDESVKHTVFVAEDAGAVVGFVTVKERAHFTGAPEAYVGELVVAEEAEGRGVGRALMAAVENWARAHGLDRVSLDTGAANTAARNFYDALGYEESDVRLSKSVT